jgi:hypothetical protein
MVRCCTAERYAVELDLVPGAVLSGSNLEQILTILI